MSGPDDKAALVEKSIECAATLLEQLQSLLGDVPPGEQHTAATYALSRALATVVVHGLGHAPQRDDYGRLFKALAMHCDIVAAHQEAGHATH